MTKQFARYESYKDSGVAWLGQIPISWELLSNKHLFIIKKNVVGKLSANYDLLSLTLHGVIKRDMENPQGKFPAEFNTYQKVNNNDFIFCLFDVEETPRTVGLSKFNGMITGAYTVMSIQKNKYNNEYFYYFYLNIDAAKMMKPLYTGLRNTIQKETFMSFKSVVPSVEEQQKIADFLDKKTAQIDEAIAQKEKMIELLKEYRQITINNAVTKGLDPDVLMKDSGIEWLGQILAHWEIKKLKFILTEKLKYGANESGIDYSEKLPRYIRITDFGNNGKLSDVNKLSLPTHIANDYLLKDGDILFARSGGTVGKSYQFRNNISYDESYCFAGYLIKASANEQIILSDFLYLYTNSPLFYLWKDFIFNKATIENIGADKYAQLPVIIPPIEEQTKILEVFKELNDKIEASIICKQQEIEKLKEYKATLIDSAVTGKIKV